jgi:hypothetical protein
VYGEAENGDPHEETEAPLFLWQHLGRPIELHALMHGFAEHVIYHIPQTAFTSGGLKLPADAANHSISINKPFANDLFMKLPRFKIPGGNMKKPFYNAT